MSREDILQAGAFFEGEPFSVRYHAMGGGPENPVFDYRAELEDWVASPDCREPEDGLWLVQEQVPPQFPCTVRCEFVGGKFLYAAERSTENGSVRLVEDFWDPIIPRYEEFLADNRISIVGIEFVRSRTGEIVTYDVSTNSRYDAAAEAAAGLYGMRAVAGFLGSQLAKIRWA